MGDVYGYGSSNINPSSSSNSPQDNLSLFLHQILLPPSSTPSSSSLMPKNSLNASKHENARHSDPALLSSYIKGNSAVGVSENVSDEYECESEGDAVERMVEEVQAKPVPPRSSYKRSRTAEVHNLSKKRRRSRINKKMKALQNLIPNSNKTDKASTLDEAIEYLKQLQLQVQILSMRNGLSLHPMCFPEGLQPLQFSKMRMYGTSFGIESPIPGHLRPFEFTRSSEHQQLNANNSDANPLGGSQGRDHSETVLNTAKSLILTSSVLKYDEITY